MAAVVSPLAPSRASCPVVRAAERIAAGDLDEHDPTVPRRPRWSPGDRRGAVARDARRDPRRRHDRPPHRRSPNRPAILAALFGEVERADRYDRPLAVAFVDIDLFKNVNDTYGHEAGDVVLRGVAATLRSNIRSDRHARALRRRGVHGRPPGDRRARPRPRSPRSCASSSSARRTPIEGQRRRSPSPSRSASPIGVGRTLRVEDLVRDADAAMYSAKALGRNQVYLFEEPDEDARIPRAPISPEGRARAIEVGRLARAAAEQALIQTLAPYPNHRGQPSARIATLAVLLGRRLGLPDAELDRLRLAALLHDVGKLALPEEILEKPAALTSPEWQAVVQHPRIGQVILEQASAIQDAVPIVLHHHERFGGSGYPYGLRGQEIPLGARIVALADAYDAMVQDRPYKAAMSHVEAIRELRRHAGTPVRPRPRRGLRRAVRATGSPTSTRGSSPSSRTVRRRSCAAPPARARRARSAARRPGSPPRSPHARGAPGVGGPPRAPCAAGGRPVSRRMSPR